MAVERATILVGPALILTSVVLACGLAVTVFSDLPSLRLFGWLSAFAMLAALIADLLDPAADGDVPDQPVAADSRQRRYASRRSSVQTIRTRRSLTQNRALAFSS